MRQSTLVTAAPLFVAALLSSNPHGWSSGQTTTTRTYSDASHSTTTADRKQEPPRSKNNNDNDDCPFYGCPIYPADVHYNTQALKDVLLRLRELPAEQVDDKVLQSGDTQTKQWNRRDAASLTLIGYKGGPLQQQVNQDRAVVVSPFHVVLNTKEAGDSDETTLGDNGNENENPNTPVDDVSKTTDDAKEPKRASVNADEEDDSDPRILLGVFDGHATRGELVSEYTVQNLPKSLSQRLAKMPPPAAETNITSQEQNQRQALTVQALHETFVEMDKTVPADPSGGCTATVVLRQDQQIYVANAGDSRAFVVAYRPSTNRTHILYISREDKPSLPDEKARVEAMGGQVYIPMRGTSRVVYQDPNTNAPSGLAMSRSIGDWAAGKLGVIPDPIVDVLSIPELVQTVLQNETEQCYVMDENGEIDTGACSSLDDGTPLDDVHIFAVAATDGMLDYLAEDEIAKVLARSLFDEGATHPVSACELLIFSAANGWQTEKAGRYRDDIAIAVSTMRQPPPEEENQAQETES